MYLATLYVFVGIAVVSAADEKQDYVERNFRMSDALNDPHYSSVTAAKNGFRVFTNPLGQGIMETLTVTHSDGLYVAGEKVVTESEHRRIVSELQSEYRAVVSELRDELQNTRSVLDNMQTRLQDTESEVLALVLALREVSPAHGTAILQPPTCEEPGGDKLHYNGTRWECVCKDGYSGDSCESRVPHVAPTQAAPSASSFQSVSPTRTPTIESWFSRIEGCREPESLVPGNNYSSCGFYQILADDVEAGDNFGHVVALSATYLAAGASGDDEMGIDSGSVYVYGIGTNLSSGVPVSLFQKVTAPDATANDRFGRRIALSSVAMVVTMTVRDRDAVYLYETNAARNGDTAVSYRQKLTGPSNFGTSIALSESHLAVGSPSEVQSHRGFGRVYIYRLDFASGGNPAAIVQTLTAWGSGIRNFGFQVALSESYLVVSTGDSATYVYYFSSHEDVSTPAVYVQTLTPNHPYHLSGWALALSANYLAVTGHWNGGPRRTGHYYPGVVYVYELSLSRDGNPARLIQQIQASSNNQDRFGVNLAFAGSYLFVGVPHEGILGDVDPRTISHAWANGTVYLYEINLGTTAREVTFVQKVEPSYGGQADGLLMRSQSLAFYENHIVIGTVGLDTQSFNFL